MDKIKIVFAYLAYPFTIANYFRRAFERRDDVELFTLGAFTGQWIPWNGGMQISTKYLNSVDLPLPPAMLHPSWEQIENMLPWKPDLCLTVDAGWNFSTKPKCLSAHIATDPHVLDYSAGRKNSDFFFNMQPAYIKEGDILLPYAFDPVCHFPDPNEPTFDCSLIGLHYPHRSELVSTLGAHGISVRYGIGDIYDEYRQKMSSGFVGINWSSLRDVTARVFEIMAMRRIPLLNRLPHLKDFGFIEDVHYLGFDSVSEAVDKVKWAKNNSEDALSIARQANYHATSHQMTYDARVDFLLWKVGLHE